jgi:hypothetical protein
VFIPHSLVSKFMTLRKPKARQEILLGAFASYRASVNMALSSACTVREKLNGFLWNFKLENSAKSSLNRFNHALNLRVLETPVHEYLTVLQRAWVFVFMFLNAPSVSIPVPDMRLFLYKLDPRSLWLLRNPVTALRSNLIGTATRL